jgi:hypothetical protein
MKLAPNLTNLNEFYPVAMFFPKKEPPHGVGNLLGRQVDKFASY